MVESVEFLPGLQQTEALATMNALVVGPDIVGKRAALTIKALDAAREVTL